MYFSLGFFAFLTTYLPRLSELQEDWMIFNFKTQHISKAGRFSKAAEPFSVRDSKSCLSISLSSFLSFFLIVFITSCSNCLSAQSDTTLLLPEIKLTETSLRNASTGSRTENWNSQTLEKNTISNISEILNRESGIFIKSYGVGSLATSSVRGGSAGHTALIWNGFSLQSPMLGLLDLSFLPTVFVDEMSLNYGGNSAPWGNGAIGGVIALKNIPKSRDGISVGFQNILGSFDNWDSQLKMQYRKGKFAGSTRVFYQKAENDFEYTISPDLPKKRQTNSAFSQGGILQEVYWKPKINQQLAWHIWWQQSDRAIPPTTTQTRSEAAQKDDIFRTTLNWKSIGRQSVFQIRSAFFEEEIDYRDDLIGLRAITKFRNIIGELEYERHIKNMGKVHFGLNQTFTKAFAEAYEHPPTEYRGAIFAALQTPFAGWDFQIHLRQEWAEKQSIPFIPSLGFEKRINAWLISKTKFSRNFRLPTFNDRFWRPGGNVDLKPESGWSAEFSLIGTWKIKKHHLKYSLTGFNRTIENWILWSIREGEAFYSANNIAKVWSRGLEQRMDWQFQKNHLKIKSKAGYDYVLSTNKVAIENPKILEGEQLFYVPKHKAFGLLELDWKNIGIYYRHTLTSSISTILEPLDGYQVGYLGVDYEWIRNRFSGLLFFQIDNLWDKNYRVVERRPMPGRHFRLGLKMVYHSK